MNDIIKWKISSILIVTNLFYFCCQIYCSQFDKELGNSNVAESPHSQKIDPIRNASQHHGRFKRLHRHTFSMSNQENRPIVPSQSTSYDSMPPTFVHPFCDQMITAGKVCAEAEYSTSVTSNVLPTARPLTILPNQIRAHDPIFRNATIQYYFVNGEPVTYGNYFAINPRTGAVFQTKPIPVDTNGQPAAKKFVILIMAARIGFKSLFSTAKLVIDVETQDVVSISSNLAKNRPQMPFEPSTFNIGGQNGGGKNLHPPVLQVTGVRGYIDEFAKSGSIVRTSENFDSRPLQILVTDQDLVAGMPPATYQYVLTGPGASLFAINQAGYIYVNIPNFLPQSYALNIQAREVNTNPVRSSQIVTLNVTVLSSLFKSAQYPKFSLTNYYVLAAPEVDFQNVLKIKAIDEEFHSKNSRRLDYKILSVTNEGNDLFAYNSDFNMLQAVKPLSAQEKYTVALEAKDEQSGKSARTNIDIEVGPLRFPTSSRIVTTRMTTERIPKLFLPDVDSDLDDLKFKFEKTFTTPKPWPNPAVFNVTISEFAPVNSVVASFKTLGSLNSRFKIIRGNEFGLFRLDPLSGVLYTDSRLDWTNGTDFRLVIAASDGFNNSSMQLNAKILKVRPPASLFTTTSSTMMTSFVVQSVGQDFSEPNDNAGSSVKILNEVPVQFSITELPPHYYVGQILVENNEHGRFDFRLDAPHRLFSIGPRDGVIKTRSQINTQQGSIHHLKVTISRLVKGQSSKISGSLEILVTIHVTSTTEEDTMEFTSSSTTTTTDRTTENVAELFNDEKFYFLVNFYNVSVQENAGPKELVRVQATNGRGKAPMYEILQGDRNLFSIHPVSGVISTLVDLDAERQQVYTLVVGVKHNEFDVTNGGAYNATATIIINVLDTNDWTPRFAPDRYYFAVADDFLPGTPIYRLQADDKDNSPPNNLVNYYLHKNPNGFHEFFSIDRDTGLLSVAKHLGPIDTNEFQLVVEAKDSGRPSLSSTALVTITVVRKPTVKPTRMESVATAAAEIHYETTTTSRGIKLWGLRNDQGQMKFSLKTASVTIPEDAVMDYLVQILPVENKPLNKRYITCDIVSGNVQDVFVVYVNADGNCEIRIRSQDILDREQIEQHALNVTVGLAEDGQTATEISDFTILTVVLSDINDNAPEFQYDDPESLRQNTYFGAVDLYAKEFTTILNVKAIDKDMGKNAEISYQVEPVDLENELLFKEHKDDWKYFTITEEKGELKNVKVLADEIFDHQSRLLMTSSSSPLGLNGRYFQFRIRAQDNPPDIVNDQKSSICEVKINVITNANRFAMLLEGIAPEQAYKYLPEIKKSLNNRTGPCTILGVDSVRTGNKGSTDNENPSTEVTMYAIEPTTGIICHRDQFSNLFKSDTMDQVRGELDAYFRVQNLSPTHIGGSNIGSNKKSHFSPSSSSFPIGGLGSKWGAAEIGFIVLASLIAIGALGALIVACCLCTKYGKRKPRPRRLIPPDKMRLYGIMPSKYNETPAYSDKEYETQITRMAMSDENNRYSRTSNNNNNNNVDYSIDEVGGIYTIQGQQIMQDATGQLSSTLPADVARQSDLLFPQTHSKVYIPPPDYPPVPKKGGNDRRETLTIL